MDSYFEATTVHGFSYIHGRYAICTRIFWFCIIVAGFTIASRHVLQTTYVIKAVKFNLFIVYQILLMAKYSTFGAIKRKCLVIHTANIILAQSTLFTGLFFHCPSAVIITLFYYLREIHVKNCSISPIKLVKMAIFPL